MTESMAIRAILGATGERAASAMKAASGMSSDVWSAEAGGRRWAVRIPISGSGRRPSYRSESRIGALLVGEALPVATWRLVDVDGTTCSVAPWLEGRPIDLAAAWTDDLAAQLAAVLDALHRLPATGWGPLEDTDEHLQGMSVSAGAGVTDRWFHARIWPFDDTTLDGHPVSMLAPHLTDRLDRAVDAILQSAEGPGVVVHSDLHPEHLLVDRDGRLAAVLDFGDAFIGSAAWDFALLTHYYGIDAARRVAAHHPHGEDLVARGRHLAVAVGVYKLAKNPNRPGLVEIVEASTGFGKAAW